jgi:hypothetical protein
MRKILLNSAVFILLFGVFASTTLAGNNSYSIAVSCTIPAIPGVNAPMIEEQSTYGQAQYAANVNTEQATNASELTMIEKEQLLTPQDGAAEMVTTLYSR